jgi:hypothetical protein
MDETYKNYLGDLGYLIRELAEDAKREANAARSEYAQGYAMAFHRVITLMQQQAEAFEIPVEQLNLGDFSTERYLAK